jgi:hypothetical protein
MNLQKPSKNHKFVCRSSLFDVRNSKQKTNVDAFSVGNNAIKLKRVIREQSKEKIEEVRIKEKKEENKSECFAMDEVYKEKEDFFLFSSELPINTRRRGTVYNCTDRISYENAMNFEIKNNEKSRSISNVYVKKIKW